VESTNRETFISRKVRGNTIVDQSQNVSQSPTLHQYKW